jgi:HEPN domain-containing protein
MSPANDWRDWLARAESDFLNIENNLQSARVPWDTICFHAQQAAEKYLKGFLVARGSVAPKIHDLEVLANQCAGFDSGFLSLKFDCQELNVYAVLSRYPEGQVPPEQKCRELVEAARRVKAAVLAASP